MSRLVKRRQGDYIVVDVACGRGVKSVLGGHFEEIEIWIEGLSDCFLQEFLI